MFGYDLQNYVRLTSVVSGRECKRCKRKTVHTLAILEGVSRVWRCNKCGKKTKAEI